MPPSLSYPTTLVRQNLDRLTTHLTSLYHTRKPAFFTLTAATIGTLALLRAAYNDYIQFLSYGPGGVPYNLLGWFISGVVLRPIGVNVTDTRPFAKDPDKRSWLGDDWPAKKRRGDARPQVGPHPVPQRQLDQHASKDIQQNFLLAFNALALQNASIVQLAPSKYEGHTEAMWVHPDSTYHAYPNASGSISREISHVHATGDYSAHVVLSPTDTKKVINAGWGQLHPLAGVRLLKLLRGGKMLPREYVMLYAPRDEEEIKVCMGIVGAGMGFMTGEEVKEVA